MMAITPSDIAANADVCQKIFAICDIEVVHDEGASWITIDGSTDFSVIARDGTGGLFLVTPLSPRIVYVSSEGEAGVIADDLEALMTLIVTCPWWQDLLKYSGKGDSVDEMRRAAPFLESSWIGEEEEFAAAREFPTSGLGIAEPRDLIGALHGAVTTPIDVCFHGQPATPLFGRFTIDDNPFYRRRR